MTPASTRTARKALLVGLIAMNAFALAWTAWNIVRSRENYERAAETTSLNLATALDQQISDSVERIDLQLQSTVDFLQDRLTRAPQLEQADVNRFLSNTAGRVPELFGIRIANAQGLVTLGLDVDREKHANWNERDLFKSLRDGSAQGLVISDPILGKVTHQWVISFARRYNYPDGRFAGIVSASVSIQYLYQLLSTLNVGEHGIALLRDSQYRLITRFPAAAGQNAAVGASKFSEELRAALQANQRSVTFHAESTSDNVNRTDTLRRIAKTPFVLVAGVAPQDYLTPWKQDSNSAAVQFLLFLSCTTLAFLYLNRALRNAEDLTRAKAQFLANMSHEIRTPMNAILGLLNLLLRTDLTRQQRDYTTKTDGAAKGLLALLNDILDFSKLDADKVQLEQLPFSLELLLRNTSVLLSSILGDKPIDILFDVDPQLPDMVIGDKLRLQQVLINLGGNAIKFTTTGQVVIALRKLPVPAGIGSGTTAIAFGVSDSGIGIDSASLARIFDTYSQAETSTTRRFGGTGLGLAISKRLVQLMGGEIRIASTVGKGSTFSFVLNVPIAAGSTSTFDGAEKDEHGTRHVLVVDDNPVALDCLRKMVEALRWTCDTATSGVQAIALTGPLLSSGHRACPYSVILVDCNMPDMDGWDSIRAIRQQTAALPGSAPIIIMLSANGRAGLTSRSEEDQALINDFLVKPLTALMLKAAVTGAQSERFNIRRMTAGRSSKRQLAGMRILVVEDNLVNQQVAEELLTNEGAIVSLAANGQQGVDAVRNAAPQFDVVLMDIQMPIMDGYTATDVIRKELGNTELPVIAMTANAMSGDREACMCAGMTEHIGKPFDLAKLVSLLIRITGLGVAGDAAYNAVAPSAEAAASHLTSLIEGLDLKTALSRMSGAASLYVRTARDFNRILCNTRIDMASLHATGQRDKLLMLLHTLKGNAGTLGATALAAEAARAETHLKAEPDLSAFTAHMEPLTRAADQTQELLARAMDYLSRDSFAPPQAGGPATSTMLGAGAVIDKLEELRTLLQNADLGAIAAFAGIRSNLTALPDDMAAQLDHALERLDFDSAGKLCQQALAQLRTAAVD